jgi:hypothetical protein
LKKLGVSATTTLFLLVMSIEASAQAATPTVTVNATLATALRLTVATSTTPAGLAVSPAGAASVYTIANFGNTDGIGLTTPTAGVTLLTGVNPGSTCTTAGAAWTTPVTLRGTWTGSGSTTATVKVKQKTLTSGGATVVSLANSTDGTSGTLIALTTSDQTIFPALTKNTNTTDYMGWLVCGESAYTGSTAISGEIQLTMTVP